jgi:pimeloyl-ACP methyl ester carboxylesterase
MWEHPAPARFLRGLAAGATVTALDRRGCGLSRREPRPTLDGWVDDALAVLDATSVDQPVVVGVGDGAAAAVMLAATHPARVRGLCLLGSGVCGAGRGADGPARLAEALRLLRERWGAPLFVEALAPGLAGDAGYRRWWAGLLRGGAGRAEAERMLRAGVAIDVAPVAPTIRVPTLVVHRREDAVSPVAEARRLADRIPGARLVELPGADHAPWSGDSEPLLAAVHEFVAGIPTAVLTTALAATVLVARLTRPDRRASKALAELFRRELALARGVPLPGGDEARRLGVFDAPGRAFACARSLSAAMSAGHHGVAVGVETGELQAGHELAGPVVDRAAALCDDAAPGAVALGATIRGLLASFTGGPEPEPPPR